MSIEARPIRLSPMAKFVVVAIVVALMIILIQTIGQVMTPFVAAAITAYLFNPLIRWLSSRTRVSRVVWIMVLYILVGTIVSSLVRSVGPIIGFQYHDLQNQIPAIINSISEQVSQYQTITIGSFEVDITPIERPLLDFAAEIGRAVSSEVPHLFFTALESVLLFVTYLIVTFYFLLQADQIVEAAYGLVPAPYRAEIRGLGAQVDAILSGYIRGTLLLIPIMSILTFILLSVLGIRYALVIAIATGVLEIIPLIGPWSAAGIAMAVALFQPMTPFGWEHWVLALVVGASYFVLRMFEDNFIIPYVVGHAVHLHPVLVLFAILAGGAIGGPFGLLVAIPAVAIVLLLLRYLYRKLIDEPELPPPDMTPPRAQRVKPPVRSVPRATKTLKSPRS